MEDKLLNKQGKFKRSNSFTNNQYPTDNTKQEIDYFIAGPGRKADKVTSAKSALKIHNEYSNVFTGNRCSKGTFSLQVKDDVKPYQISCAIQEPFKKEMERLQGRQILMSLGSR